MPRNPDQKPAPPSEKPASFPLFQQEMNRLFDRFRRGFSLPEPFDFQDLSKPLFPAVDVVETDNRIEVSAEVPGMQEADIDATISGNVLILSGEKRSDHDEADDNLHRIERRYGAFRRQIPLGFTPDDDAVKAEAANGVLKITIRKPATTKPEAKKIHISKG